MTITTPPGMRRTKAGHLVWIKTGHVRPETPIPESHPGEPRRLPGGRAVLLVRRSTAVNGLGCRRRPEGTSSPGPPRPASGSPRLWVPAGMRSAGDSPVLASRGPLYSQGDQMKTAEHPVFSRSKPMNSQRTDHGPHNEGTPPTVNAIFTNTIANPQQLSWTKLDWDASNDVAAMMFGRVEVADIGSDDALWVEPLGLVWSLSHNTVELSRHDDIEAAKRAAEAYFSTL